MLEVGNMVLLITCTCTCYCTDLHYTCRRMSQYWLKCLSGTRQLKHLLLKIRVEQQQIILSIAHTSIEPKLTERKMESFQRYCNLPLTFLLFW